MPEFAEEEKTERRWSRSLPCLTDALESLNDRLLFAVPKKGRLHQACLDLLQGSDIQFHRHSRLDIALVKNHQIALVFLPAADIPTFVGEGRVDLGITGRDQVAEHEVVVPPTAESGVDEVLDLDFGRCNLQVQVPEKGTITKPEELIGKNVVTSFTNLAESYFRKLEAEQEGGEAVANGSGKPKLKTNIKYIGGSVEAACALGVADGIVDLVESGETMRAAGLKAISTVISSTAILIKNRHPSSAANEALVTLIAARIRGVITAQRYVLCTYNIHRDQLDAACKITPGKRAPTINSLEEPGWVAVSAMVEKKKISLRMDELEKVGAEDILVMNLENSRTKES
ncbi:ATP phosphoribosyltransferas-like protein [Aulographum hederae CBS 113979]|uniref:ATP phosphoribosyltransferase n=1 Tax=Aulographum hederae CBS 113979 TaxID=1176131 RepID=A0A6G1GN33_9PEZI|nr:ATP phosphoribosyltransferas-like protein [Aulographum hederae CBS 113979]